MTDLFDQPHTRARSGDRDTSHKAAAAIMPVRFTIRAQVEQFALDAGIRGFIDEDLISAFPEKTPSTLRTRRSELGFENIILDTGYRRHTNAGRETIVWLHRDHHRAPPPRKEPEPVVSRSHQIAILEAQKRALQIAMREAIASPERATSILTAALAAIN
jgi:hypothetical protein